MVLEYRVGNVTDELRAMSEKSIHLVVTSPPYYGLRAYKGEQRAWFGAKDGCNHELAPAGIPNTKFAAQGSTETVKYKVLVEEGKTRPKSSSVCVKCGGWYGQLGLEPSPDAFVAHLVEIFAEVKRVLRDDGIVFLNIGDSFAGGGGATGIPADWKSISMSNREKYPVGGAYPLKKVSGVKPKSRIGIPQRLMLALMGDDWIVRQDIIFAKKSPLPEPCVGWRWERCRKKSGNHGGRDEPYRIDSGRLLNPQQGHDGSDFLSDAVWAVCNGCDKCSKNDGYVLRKGAWRPTCAHEYIFMLTKSGEYYSDGEDVREPCKCPDEKRIVVFGGPKGLKAGGSIKNASMIRKGVYVAGVGRNMRDVWQVPPGNNKTIHHAAFSLWIPETCIKIATSRGGYCADCGEPYARVLNIERPDWEERGRTTEKEIEQRASALEVYGSKDYGNGDLKGRSLTDIFGSAVQSKRDTIGWKKICECATGEKIVATVLDPFCGSGTTLLAAKNAGINGIGVDISEIYKAVAKKRIYGGNEPLLEEWK